MRFLFGLCVGLLAAGGGGLLALRAAPAPCVTLGEFSAKAWEAHAERRRADAAERTLLLVAAELEAARAAAAVPAVGPPDLGLEPRPHATEPRPGRGAPEVPAGDRIPPPVPAVPFPVQPPNGD